MSKTTDLNRLWAELMIEGLVRNGACAFCITPGSRSTSLTLAAADNPAARCIVHYDERGAAYHALGLALATGRPAVLMCTSGTAVANYMPAVVEASNAHVPMIVLTADRPPELLDTGANQVIRQTGIFGEYTRWRFDLPCPDDSIRPEFVLTTIDQACHRATRSPAGPVHLNCPFREPFATQKTDTPIRGPVGRWQESKRPYTDYARAESCPAEENLATAELLAGAERGLVIVGQLKCDKERDAALGLIRTLGWPAFADVTSGLRLGAGDDAVIPYLDQLLLCDTFRDFCAPDMVLHIGGQTTSKRLRQHIEQRPPREYVRVTDHPMRLDPSHGVSLRIESSVRAFLASIEHSAKPERNRSWTERMAEASRLVHDTVSTFLDGRTALTEPGVAHAISRLIPADTSLFVGNSMPIRDMDMYADPTGACARVFANRGASGIDGNVATAAGIASGSGLPVTALIGDLALLHDINSLSLVRDAAAPVTLVVVNNDGGGIFHFLPVSTRGDAFERYFATPHGLRFDKAAGMFGLAHTRPESMGEFAVAYEDAARAKTSTLIEVVTDRDENRDIHTALQDAIIAKLASF